MGLARVIEQLFHFVPSYPYQDCIKVLVTIHRGQPELSNSICKPSNLLPLRSLDGCILLPLLRPAPPPGQLPAPSASLFGASMPPHPRPARGRRPSHTWGGTPPRPPQGRRSPTTPWGTVTK